jgi:serine/threonine-protein kinase
MQCPICQQNILDDALFCPECGTRLAPSSLAQPPVVLQQRFELVRKLGQGGMGAVYLAHDRRLSTRQWAIKEMSDAALTSPLERQQATAAFKHEAELLAGLSHPNLPHVADYFSENGKNYLVMEFVPGESVLSYIQREGLPRPLTEVLDWAYQICDVLAYLHTQQPPVIFRDLKPSNVMLTPQNRIKLIDFGIARVFKPGKAKDTQAFGTMGYSAPEQYGKGQTDARSDIYSLGVLLHQLLTGHDPVSTPFRLPPPGHLNPNIPTDVSRAISRATEADPNARYADMAEFRAALDDGTVVPATAETRLVSPLPAQSAMPPMTPQARSPEMISPAAPATTADAAAAPAEPDDAHRPRSSSLARVTLWMGALGLALVAFSTVLAIWANVANSENLGFVATLLGSPAMITSLTAPILGFIALARNETARSLYGRREAIIGTVCSLFTLPLCCAILVIFGNLAE